MSALRIGFLCSEYPPDSHGGIGSFVQDLARSLATRGHFVLVAGYSNRDAIEDDLGVVVHRLRRRSALPPHLRMVTERLRLARLLTDLVRRYKLDLIEVPDWHGEAAFFSSMIPPSCRCVVRLHGSASALAYLRGTRCSRHVRFMEARTVRAANARIAVSTFIADATARALPGVPEADAVIPNFVDTNIFAALPGFERDANLVAFAGRFSMAKGAGVFFETAAELIRLCRRARFEVAGEIAAGTPPPPPSLSERIQFRGTLPRHLMPAFFSGVAFVIVPTRAEAFGLTAIEAMACGCVPVVLTASGPAEFIHHRRTGLVANDPVGLAAEIAWALEHPGETAAIRAEARAHVANRFSVDGLVDENISFYNRVSTNALARSAPT